MPCTMTRLLAFQSNSIQWISPLSVYFSTYNIPTLFYNMYARRTLCRSTIWWQPIMMMMRKNRKNSSRNARLKASSLSYIHKIDNRIDRGHQKVAVRHSDAFLCNFFVAYRAESHAENSHTLSPGCDFFHLTSGRALLSSYNYRFCLTSARACLMYLLFCHLTNWLSVKLSYVYAYMLLRRGSCQHIVVITIIELQMRRVCVIGGGMLKIDEKKNLWNEVFFIFRRWLFDERMWQLRSWLTEFILGKKKKTFLNILPSVKFL